MNNVMFYLQIGLVFLVLLFLRKLFARRINYTLYKLLWIGCMMCCFLPKGFLASETVLISVSEDFIVKSNFDGLHWIQLSGSVVLIILFLYRYLSFSKVLHRSLPFANQDTLYELRYSDEITTPCTFGLVKPSIYLPKDVLAKDTIHYIIKHEEAHIQHRDPMMNIILLGLCCMQWMNPVLWLCMKQIRKEMELICDQEVTNRFSLKERKAYATLLIEMIQEKPSKVLTFATSDYKERINLIMKKVNHKKTVVVSLVACGIFVMLGGMMLRKPIELKASQGNHNAITEENVETSNSFANGKYTLSKEE